MIMFESELPTFKVARKIFENSFYKESSREEERICLRGSIVKANNTEYLRREHKKGKPFDNIGVCKFSDYALDAI